MKAENKRGERAKGKDAPKAAIPDTPLAMPDRCRAQLDVYRSALEAEAKEIVSK